MNIAFLFDFDGVIADSEPLHLQTFRKVVAPFGIRISKKRWYTEFVGTGSPHIMKTLLEEKGIRDKKLINDLVAQRRELFQEGIRQKKLKAKKGIENFLKKAKKSKIKTAVVSGGHKENVALALSVLGLDRYFDLVIGREDYQKRKPHPECYLLAAKKLGVKPERCIVFEDSISGCLAAKRAGMKVVAVKAPVTVECEADAKIKDFEKLDSKFVKKLPSQNVSKDKRRHD